MSDITPNTFSIEQLLINAQDEVRSKGVRARASKMNRNYIVSKHGKIDVALIDETLTPSTKLPQFPWMLQVAEGGFLPATNLGIGAHSLTITPVYADETDDLNDDQITYDIERLLIVKGVVETHSWTDEIASNLYEIIDEFVALVLEIEASI